MLSKRYLEDRASSFERLNGRQNPAGGGPPPGFFEVPRPPGDGLCSDDQCPCPENLIPRGTGYVFISQDVVNNRRNARSVAEAQVLADRMQQEMSRRLGVPAVFVASFKNVLTPVLMCEQGARLRGIDLAVAAADAKHWWETG